MRWDELEAAAPELARLGRQRLEDARVALLGTLRRDGAPRISPIEPYLSGGELLFGAMTRSEKTRDLSRDPRCTLHSAVSSPDSGEGELKLLGRAVVADDATRQACEGGWWRTQPEDAATVFALRVEQATFVSWDLDAGRLTIRSWSPAAGYAERRRPYP